MNKTPPVSHTVCNFCRKLIPIYELRKMKNGAYKCQECFDSNKTELDLKFYVI